MSRQIKGTCPLSKAIYTPQMVSRSIFLMKAYGNAKKIFSHFVKKLAAAIRVLSAT